MIEFVYFDFGNVVCHFDHRLAARQMADVSGISAEQAWEVVLASGLNDRFDAGELSTAEFHREFCQQTGTSPALAALTWAYSEIFALNVPMLPLISQLAATGMPLGLLSNMSPPHWEYISSGRYSIVDRSFAVRALSFQLKATKPHQEIYDRAAALAGVPKERIFFVDDMPGHVAGARSAGWQAELFESAALLASQLRDRGVRFNY